MEKKDFEKVEALQAAALLQAGATLLNDVQGLKDVLDMSSIKQQMMANIMLVDDKEVLDRAAKALHIAIFQKKPMDTEGPTPIQGNG